MAIAIIPAERGSAGEEWNITAPGTASAGNGLFVNGTFGVLIADSVQDTKTNVWTTGRFSIKRATGGSAITAGDAINFDTTTQEEVEAPGGFFCGRASADALAGSDRVWVDINESSGPGGGLQFTDVKIADYTATAGEIVMVDPAGGPITITAPLSPALDTTFAVKLLDDGVVNVDAVSIESPISNALVASVVMWSQASVIIWRYDGTSWLLMSAAAIDPWVEVWQATPIASIGTPSTVQWTFVPFFPGQQPLLLTEVAGVFTYQPTNGITIQVAVDVEMAFDSAAGNEDATYAVDFTEVLASSPALFVRMVNSFQTSRAGNFPVSGSSSGVFPAVQGDDYRVTAELVTASSGSINVDLDGGLLTFSTG